MRAFLGIAIVVSLLFGAPAGAAAQSALPLDRVTRAIDAVTAPIVGTLEGAPPAVEPPSPPSPAVPGSVKLPPAVSEATYIVTSPVTSAKPTMGTDTSMGEAAGQVGATGSAVAATVDASAGPDAHASTAEPAGSGLPRPGRTARRGSLNASRPAHPRSFLAYVWPAVALGHPQLNAFLSQWESSTVSLLSSFAPGAAAALAGGDSAPARQTATARDEFSRIAEQSSLDRLLPPDPPLPIAIFYLALIAAVGAIWLSSRRELGLRMVWHRWKG
jgi:hypothetical protein